MRVLTVSELKGGKSARGAHRDYPTLNSVADRIYKRLLAERGRPVFIGDIADKQQRGTALTTLQDHYGLDIRKANRRHDGRYILAGEWFGAHYSDYVVAAIDAAVAAKAA